MVVLLVNYTLRPMDLDFVCWTPSHTIHAKRPPGDMEMFRKKTELGRMIPNIYSTIFFFVRELHFPRGDQTIGWT